MPREIWRNIKNWPLHQVSSRGRVRALPGAQVKRRIVKRTELRKLTLNAAGYVMVRNGWYVHRLMLQAFRGPSPKGAMSRHLNGNRSDNRLNNLRWGTNAENQTDRAKHGTSNHGERNGQAKLSAAKVRAIRAASGPRGLNAKLAERYGVARSVISRVRTGHIWVTHAT